MTALDGAAVPEMSATGERTEASDHSRHLARPVRVLLADDSQDVRLVLATK